MAGDEFTTLVEEMKSMPGEPFNFRLHGDRLLIAVRCDTGEVWCWEAKVTRWKSWMERRQRKERRR